MEIILEIMEDGKEIELEQVIEYMKINYAHILDERVFYDFWIMLHQVSPITIDGDEGNHIGLFEEVIKLLIGRYKGLKVEESNKILMLTIDLK